MILPKTPLIDKTLNHVKNQLLKLLAIFFIALTFWLAYLHWGLGQVWADYTGFKNKTFWDLLQLLVVPLVLAVGAYLLDHSGRKNEQKIAEDHKRDTALQTYIDKMTELLLDKDQPLRESKPEDEVRVVARTRTLTTLRSLDAVRKGMLIKFLYEARLITKGEEVIDLCDADLTGMTLIGDSEMKGLLVARPTLTEISLKGANLFNANLSNTDLSKADLSHTHLTMAILKRATLHHTNFYKADMNLSFFIGADLRGANFQKTVIMGADFRGTDLRGADMREAGFGWTKLQEANMRLAKMDGASLFFSNLTGAKVTDEQLSKVNDIDHVTMPDGKKYNPAIHLKLEDEELIDDEEENLPAIKGQD